MGVANRELCQRFLDAYRPDGLDDLLALLHPDIEWTSGVFELRDGLIIRIVGHSDPADALAAVP